MRGSDDHYIPNIHNARVDTRAFEQDLGSLTQGLTGQTLDYADLWPRVHDLIMERLSGPIEEPAEDTLICRYLSPSKFLWFVPQLALYFGSAHRFEDTTDCRIPADYYHCVQRFYLERDVTPFAWDDYAERLRARWLVSSWTELADHHDDHLLWHRYAGGPAGVGITVRYGELRELLRQESSRRKLTAFFAGRVSYGSPLRLPPFSKRRTFRNENEVRFVCQGEALASVSLSIASLRPQLGLRFSPDASPNHVNAVLETWMRWGGSDRYQIGGE